MAIALYLVALGVVGAAVGLSIYLARSASKASDRAAAIGADHDAARSQLTEAHKRVDELTRDVKDRDDVLTTKEAELARIRAAMGASEEARLDAIATLEKLAEKNPAAAAAGIRAQLDRLRKLPPA